MRALALTALWAGRLVDGVRCSALSTGVAAGSRVLQDLAAAVNWLVARIHPGDSRIPVFCLVELHSSFRSQQFNNII